MTDKDYAKLMEPFVLQRVITIGEKINRGACEVFQVEYCGIKYTAKAPRPVFQYWQYSGRDRKFLSMCYLRSRCQHPNIVQFIGIYYPSIGHGIPRMIEKLIKGIPAMVMEQMDCSLTTFITEQSKTITLHNVLSILHDVSLGVWYLHSRNPPIIHCNLTPNNILVNTSSMVAKIAGFETASEGYKGDVLIPGSLCFMPPEALKEPVSYGLPLDVFSYGGTALYAVVGEWPLNLSKHKFDLKTKKKIALSEVERRHKYLDRMIGEAEVLRPLVEMCLNDDPAVRPTIDVVSESIKVMEQNYMDCHPETKVHLNII